MIKVDKAYRTIRTLANKVAKVLLTTGMLILASCIIYGSFYFAFVPATTHQTPVNLQFEPCVESPSKCGYLNASVSLGNPQPSTPPILMAGQAYTVVLALEMPDSPKNLELGMFMSCLDLKGLEEAETLRRSCKSSMIRYKSSLLRKIETIILAPLLISGNIVEKQTVYIEFFDDFFDDPLNPIAAADVLIKSRFAEIYNSKLMIHAKFGGIRYLMFYYPVTSALMGTTLNFSMLSIIVILSWMRFFVKTKQEEEENELDVNEDNAKEELDESASAIDEVEEIRAEFKSPEEKKKD